MSEKNKDQEIEKEIEELKRCFLCKKRFEEGDAVGNFFGALGHLKCIDKKFKKNQEKRE